MNQKTDWFPGTRDGQLDMAQNWVVILTAQGTAWNIPATEVTALSDLAAAAEAALAAAKNETTCTPVATVRCRGAFRQMEEKMRDIKRRCFFIPPLTEVDFAALDLNIPDSIHTPTHDPTAHVTAEVFLVGQHELGVRIVYISGDPNDRANKGYRIWYTAVASGEAPPSGPEQLTKSFYTKRRKEVIEFDFGDSGKTAYISIQIENDGRKGPWGPMVSAVIP